MNKLKSEEVRHSDDMQDIITAVPPWLLRWGITVFFGVLVLALCLSVFIRYPDVVKAQLKITTPDKPKQLVAKISGKLVSILVVNNQIVHDRQPLAFIESTADHRAVLTLLSKLREVQRQLNNESTINAGLFTLNNSGELGELQSAYQTFAQSFITYNTAVNDGFLIRKRAYLEKDIESLREQTNQLKAQRELQERDFNLAQEEYDMHKKLAQEKVETISELRQAESKYLSRKSPMLQTDGSLITANTNMLSKQKEIMELDNQIQDEKSKFGQALNSLLSQSEDWASRYIISASQGGRVTFAGFLQRNQVIISGQDVFYINAGNENFFGDMNIPQDNLGKVKEGQRVLVKLKGYPFEEYGMMQGRISYISDVPYKDSVFISKVQFFSKMSDMKKKVHLKEGMLANAEIITEDATIMERLLRNISKAVNSK
ncbi:HlyD family efflux transporter periplasmic adaptor subunit [Mucilaginibacter rubeus]|uniref:HlyD family efflux transporter periplasmic adaptor subunit n=1 Tax=Mucilaginibacter rubeus TaxID=2027860 RepID=A0ABX7UEE6_9SPHI|nr:HlyD family efflux transporter periplasmic adaptor subunit [Mucilaginibacter rubeus]QTE50963.1 HlyD family efflux transporter periplasmic adaptor subunit [Mucilaginibacter rubeus]QTE56046.1 HlyD family efflux transporter periplasmic adaptor subunit [Mucilaginibacter rubeus]QTF63249.1 HlyD family efflux transporter periplasmic adaptor subunit [Mucilaginibacter rubeus]